jgi:hypothetical protein
MRNQRSRGILLTGLLGIGTLATWTLLGAPTLVPGGKARPTPQPAPSLRLPPNAKKATTRLVPNLPNAPKTSRAPGQPWLTRPVSTKCVVGGECLILGNSLGQRAPGQKSPLGMVLSFHASGTVGDTRLEPTAWTPTVVGFKAPPTMAAGHRYTVLIRNAQGKAASNAVELDVVAIPNATTTPDFDGDDEPSVAAGGLDCDDFNNRRSPRRTEQADADDLDEDCSPVTFGVVDADGDGAPSVGACNVGITGTGLDRTAVWYCGSDCNDTLAAIKPGEMTCDSRDTSLVFVCTAKASWPVDPRTTAGDGCQTPYPCDYFAAGARCVGQPNGRGVCQVGAP